MATASITHTVGTSQGQVSASRTLTADGELIKNPTLTAAKTGALTTRTSGTVGTLTMDTGHGINTADLIDIYWLNADGTRGYRYSCVVGTVATNSVPFTGGGGDNLPTLVSGTYAITAKVPQLEPFAYVYTNIVMLNVTSQYPCQAVFLDGSNAVLLAVTVDGPSDGYSWDTGSGIANPLSANVANVRLSHGSSLGSAVVMAQALIN